jgi:uncharacterized protein (TIGR02246 family)
MRTFLQHLRATSLNMALLAFVWAGVAISVIGQTQDAGRRKAMDTTKEEQEITQLNQKWADWIVAGDMKALDRLFDDDLIVTSGSGVLRGKKEELDELRPTAEIKIYFFKVEDVRARVYGESAVVTGLAKWKINFKGRDVDNERRYTTVFVKRNGEWRIVAQQLTRPAPSPPK